MWLGSQISNAAKVNFCMPESNLLKKRAHSSQSVLTTSSEFSRKPSSPQFSIFLKTFGQRTYGFVKLLIIIII
jgi:hypothetical protein